MADGVSSRKTVLACFAYPDDEVGALGTLANHSDRGDRVVLAWMTCGENTSMSKAKTPAEVARERRLHGQEVGKIIGCEVAFFDYGDTQVQLTRDAAVQMGRLSYWLGYEAANGAELPRWLPGQEFAKK